MLVHVQLLNYHQEGLEDAFRTDFGITQTRKTLAHTSLVSKQALPKQWSKPERVPFAGRFRMVFLQMHEFTLTEAECTTDLEKWAYIMNHMEKLTKIPWAAQDELYAELSKVSNVAALSQKEREVYEENLRQYRDNLATLEASYLDGLKEGMEKGRQEIGRNLIALNVPDEIIMHSTGLSFEEVQQLREH